MERINPIPQYFPTSVVELITPEMAKEYLTHNEHNPRKANRLQVEAYARDLAAGKWQLNGETIVFDANGDLKNGQHRLMAIVKANTPAYVVVVRGIDPNITAFDYQKPRRLADQHGMSRNCETLANMIVSDAFRFKRPAREMTGDYMETHKDMIHRAIALSQIGATHAVGMKRDVYSAIYLLLRYGADADEIEQFMRVVNTQFMLTERESSSAIVLFKFLCDKLRTNADRASSLIGMETVITAYCDFSNGTKRTRAYKITSTSRVQNMLTGVRKEDGLEG